MHIYKRVQPRIVILQELVSTILVTISTYIFYVLRTVQLSIILVIDHLNEQILVV